MTRKEYTAEIKVIKELCSIQGHIKYTIFGIVWLDKDEMIESSSLA